MIDHDSQDAVMARLESYLDLLDNIPREAHAIYRSYDPAHLMDHTLRAEATCIYDHMVGQAERLFDTKDEIKPLVLRGLKLWLIGDHTAIRFKKMDEDGKGRNYPTKQAKDFDHNRQLDGLPAAPTRLSVGYLLDATGFAVERVQIARPNGKYVDWCAAIIPELPGATPVKRRWVDVSRQQRLA